MLPPLLRIIINEPGLLTEHAVAYSHLISNDAKLWKASVKRQILLKAMMAGGVLLALLFAGIAMMVWGATDHNHWTLIVVPLVPLLVAIVAGFMAADKRDEAPFAATKAQICTDVRMFKEGN